MTRSTRPAMLGQITRLLFCLAVSPLVFRPAGAAVDLPPDPEGQALEDALNGEIALQLESYPQAWRYLMDSAELSRDPRLAARAWDAALATENLENAARAIKLWRQTDPHSMPARLYGAVIDLIESEGPDRSRVEKALGDLLRSRRDADNLLLRVLDLAQDQTAESEGLFESLERVAELVPANSHSELLLARAGQNAGRQDRALEHALRAAALSPDDPRVLLTAADFQFPLDPAGVTRRLASFLARHPGVLPVELALARSLAASGRPDQVRERLRAINRRPDLPPQAFFALGNIAEEARLLDEAEFFYRKYLVVLARGEGDESLLPDDAYIRLGMVRLTRQDPAGATRWLSLVEEGERYFPARVHLAEILSREGRADEACQALREVRAEPEEGAKLRLLCADILTRAGRAEDAYRAADEALALAPDDPDAIYKTGLYAERAGQIDIAVALLRRYVELEPGDANGYNSLGYTMLDHGRSPEEAGALIERAMEMSDGRNGFIIDSLGWLRYLQGRYQEAEDLLRSALRVESEIDIALHLAQALMAQHKDEEALDYVLSVLRTVPGHATAERLERELRDRAGRP